MRRSGLLAIALGVTAAAGADDFWAHWGDGRAELSGYRLVQPREGAKRAGSAVFIFVTEELSDSLRVKADPGKHPKADLYPVLKLNAIRDFQTGIYDYNLMTTVFSRVSPGWPVAKVSFSSQEWCGQLYHQLLPRGDKIEEEFHSYFDGEADGRGSLPLPSGGVFEDALPILLRGWGMAYLQPGEQRTVPFLPSLLRARLDHQPLAWGKAKIARSPQTSTVTVPAGKLEVVAWTVSQEGGPTLIYQFEAAPPYRLVRWASDSGEEGQLLKSTRLPYWKLNGPGGERALRDLGLPVPVVAPPSPAPAGRQRVLKSK